MTQPDLLSWTPLSRDFDGKIFESVFDSARLSKQIKLVHDAMIDGKWRTLAEIETITGAPQASISARLRDCRKKKMGAFIVNRRRRGEAKLGIFEYQLVKP